MRVKIPSTAPVQSGQWTDKTIILQDTAVLSTSCGAGLDLPALWREAAVDMHAGRHRVLPLDLRDGTHNALVLCPQVDGEAGPVVLVLPGMGVRASYYDPLLQALHDRGLNAAATDLRGIGHSSVRAGRGTDFGYHEMLTLDLQAAVTTLRQQYPGQALYLLGHSLGGELACLYASANRGDLSGIILVASGTDYHRNWPFPLDLGICGFHWLAVLIARLWGHYPGHRLGFAGREARGTMRDLATNGRTGRFDLVGSDMDYEDLLRSVEHPVLAVTISDDRMAPPSATTHLLSKMPLAAATRIVMTPAELGAERVGHFHWVKRSRRLAERVAGWIYDHQGS